MNNAFFMNNFFLAKLKNKIAEDKYQVILDAIINVEPQRLASFLKKYTNKLCVQKR